jgi:hypothetical protein
VAYVIGPIYGVWRDGLGNELLHVVDLCIVSHMGTRPTKGNTMKPKWHYDKKCDWHMIQFDELCVIVVNQIDKWHIIVKGYGQIRFHKSMDIVCELQQAKDRAILWANDLNKIAMNGVKP